MSLRMRRVVMRGLRIIGMLFLLTIMLIGLRILVLRRIPEPTYQAAQELADSDGAFASVNGAQIYYQEHGPATGRPIILIHGFLLESASFEPLLKAFAQQGYRVIALDRPPFGLSDKSPTLDYTLDAQADLVIGLMDKLGIDKANILGHSAGGVTAARVALRYPERVTRLLLVGGSFRSTATQSAAPADQAANPAASSILMVLAQGLNPIPMWSELELRAFFTEQHVADFGRANYAEPALVPAERIQHLTRFQHIHGWEAGMRAFGRQIASDSSVTMADLAQLRIPTLILWGEQDRFVPLGIGKQVAASIPHAQFVIYPGCGHIAWEGCQSSIFQDMLAFIGDG